jgi:hypothetical protein
MGKLLGESGAGHDRIAPRGLGIGDQLLLGVAGKPDDSNRLRRRVGL